MPTGETRTYSMEEVAFAGPAQAAPWNRPSESPAPTAPKEKKPESEKPEPFITVHAEKARLNITSKEPNLTVHVKSGSATASVNLTRSIRSDAYTPICTAPCEASLPVGTHELGVSAPGDSVTAVEKPVEITGPGEGYAVGVDLRHAGGDGGRYVLGAGAWARGAGVGVGVGEDVEMGIDGDGGASLRSRAMTPHSIVRAFAFALCLCPSLVTPAWAQTVATSPSSAPPDVVLLKNGGMVRGTLLEVVPEQSVTLLLASGETRTFPMGEVTYAGAAHAAPGNRPAPAPSAPAESKPKAEEAEPFVTVHANKVRLRIVGKEPNLTVYVKSGAATTQTRWANAYTTLCTAPCEVSLPVGTHELAISRPDEGVTALGPVPITGPGTIEASLATDWTGKIAGLSVLAAGVGGGTALFLASEDKDDITAGLGVFVLLMGLCVGFPLLASPTTPASPSSRLARRPRPIPRARSGTRGPAPRSARAG